MKINGIRLLDLVDNKNTPLFRELACAFYKEKPHLLDSFSTLRTGRLFVFWSFIAETLFFIAAKQETPEGVWGILWCMVGLMFLSSLIGCYILIHTRIGVQYFYRTLRELDALYANACRSENRGGVSLIHDSHNSKFALWQCLESHLGKLARTLMRAEVDYGRMSDEANECREEFKRAHYILGRFGFGVVDQRIYFQENKSEEKPVTKV